MIDHMTLIAADWGKRCFGEAHMRDLKIRSLRLAEEAVELAQASGVGAGQMHALVDAVYERPVGDQYQEAGGVALTLAVFCWAAFNRSSEDAFETELLRVLTKTPEYFAKRNSEKIKQGLA
jgi:hypothetical protein